MKEGKSTSSTTPMASQLTNARIILDALPRQLVRPPTSKKQKPQLTFRGPKTNRGRKIRLKPRKERNAIRNSQIDGRYSTEAWVKPTFSKEMCSQHDAKNYLRRHKDKFHVLTEWQRIVVELWLTK